MNKFKRIPHGHIEVAFNYFCDDINVINITFA